MAYYLICEGGGSKTDIMVIDQTGAILSAFRTAGSNALFLCKEEVVDRLSQAIYLCLSKSNLDVSDLSKLVFFIPGFSECKKDLSKKLGRDDLILLDDRKSTIYAAFGQPYGIAVLSGTGSFAIGCNKNGQEVSCGGWGPLLGDGGSGYQIGLKGLERIAWLFDNDVKDTLLEKYYSQALGLNDVKSLRKTAYEPSFTREKIAFLSRAVSEAAFDGDPYAKEILWQASEELILLVATIARKMDVRGLPVSLLGGMSNVPLMCQYFETHIMLKWPQLKYQTALYSPVVGAALYVLDIYGDAKNNLEKVAKNLKESWDLNNVNG